jgi:hypothetical protein
MEKILLGGKEYEIHVDLSITPDSTVKVEFDQVNGVITLRRIERVTNQ